MTKHFCDACGKEIRSRVYKFNYLCHISDAMEAKHLCDGFVDMDWNPISSKEISKDLCLACYNRLFMYAYNEFRTMRSADVFRGDSDS